MNNIRIGGVIIGLLVLGIVQTHVFLFCPKMTRASETQLTVGNEDGNHATYAIGPQQSFSASSVGYDISLFGYGTLDQLGSRAILSYLDSRLYAGVVLQAKCSGSCMAGPLNAYEAQGSIGHLLLIPANDAALASMKKASLPGGAKFTLSGHRLTYESGQLEGHPFNGQLGNTGYFLVDAIEND